MLDGLRSLACDGVEVASAGTWAMEGHPPTAEVFVTLSNHSIELSHSAHAVAVTRDHVAQADLVVVMTSVQSREIEDMIPSGPDKVRLIKELPELEPPRGGSPQERLKALLRAARPEWRRDLDVNDPIGLPLAAYERAYGELRPGIDRLLDVVCEGRAGTPAVSS